MDNFSFRTTQDAEAAAIATAAVLKTLLESIEIDVERVRQLIGAAADEEPNLVARAMWFVQWMNGLHDSEGEQS